MSEHTPGPWLVDLEWAAPKSIHVRGEVSEHYPLGATTVVVLPCRRNGAGRGGRITYNPPTEEMLANARLIAAAPDLLAACEAAIPVLMEAVMAGLRGFTAKEKAKIASEHNTVTRLRNAVEKAREGRCLKHE